MVKRKVIHKASDFKYPTREERKIANVDYPSLKRFGFEYIEELPLLLSGKMKAIEVTKYSHIFQWDICLLNKLGKLHESYVFLITHYNRGIPDDYTIHTDKESLNNFLFIFYTETFYYLFFSIRDMIAQIINVYCDINLSEEEIYFNKFIPLIKNQEIKESFMSFKKLTKPTSDLRNNFTHRFPINHPDYRPTLETKDGKTIYIIGTGNYIKPSIFVNDVKSSLLILYNFINDLRNILKPTGNK
jgi:hypothetical protein